MSNLLETYRKKAENDEELSQEQVDKMVNWLDKDLTNYCKSAKTSLEKEINEIKSVEAE